MAYGNGGEIRGGYDPMQNLQNAAIGGGIGLAPAPRIPAVPAELQRMHENSERLHALLNDLENRISMVVRQEGPSAVGGADKVAPQPVALAGGLNELNVRFEGACYRLRSLLDRIEL